MSDGSRLGTRGPVQWSDAGRAGRLEPGAAWVDGGATDGEGEVEARAERELVRRAQELEEAALSDIFNRYYPRIYSYGLIQLRNVQAAEDFASDVMLRMLHGIGRYQERERPFSAWIFRIARNRLIDLRRRGRRQREMPLDERYLAGPGYGTVSQILDLQEIQEGLAALTDSQAQVIVLRFLQDMDLQTAAQVLGKSEKAVKSLQFRALASLRRVLAGREPGRGPAVAPRPV